MQEQINDLVVQPQQAYDMMYCLQANLSRQHASLYIVGKPVNIILLKSTYKAFYDRSFGLACTVKSKTLRKGSAPS